MRLPPSCQLHPSFQVVCPGFRGGGILDRYAAVPREDSMGRRGGPGRRGYPAEFRQRVVDLLDAGRTVADLARDLGISEQAIYGWRGQEQIDRGLEPGLSSGERAELAAAKRRIRDLEAELAVHRRAAQRPKGA